MTDSEDTKQPNPNTKRIVTAYPFALLLIALLINAFVFGITAPEIALPSRDIVLGLAVAAALLLINHSWLMTTTELTRLDFGMHATPEERAADGLSEEDDPAEGVSEVARRHNAHRNTTENSVYFVFLALLFSVTTPPALAAHVWILSYPVARLGYTYCYLSRNTNGRGACMSLSLLSMYGIASYLLLGLVLA